MPTVGILGVGLIGRAWANVFARADWDVVLWDANADALDRAPSLIAESLSELASHGLVDNPSEKATRVRTGSSIASIVDGASLIQESGPERLEVKQDLFTQLDQLAAPETILASSSSAIVASRFTEDLAGRSRCLIAHPVNPPHVVPIVELCGAPWTDPESIARARAIYDSVGQTTMEVKKEIDGFILNRMQAVLLAEAFRLIGEGYVTAADLDKTIKDGLGRRWSFMGPIETIELNAPGGILDYCERYGETLFRTSKLPVTQDIWDMENCKRVADSWGETPTAEHVAEKSAWRDSQLAALAAHLGSRPKFNEPE
ncbi:MAG: 3-hydroxyacyl-CoA dehydrogenase [Rhizobiales bacterium]|nr:3-hydroxyacyl-CoA dehydrogenase [Hyphomicrobiales bacterium]